MRAIILLVGSLAIVVAQQGGEAAAKAAASPLDATSIGAQLTQFLETEYFLPSSGAWNGTSAEYAMAYDGGDDGTNGGGDRVVVKQCHNGAMYSSSGAPELGR